MCVVVLASVENWSVLVIVVPSASVAGRFMVSSVDNLFLFNDLMSSQMMKAMTASAMTTVKTITTMVPVFKDLFSGIVDGFVGIVGSGVVFEDCVVVFVVEKGASVIGMKSSDNCCSGIITGSSLYLRSTEIAIRTLSLTRFNGLDWLIIKGMMKSATNVREVPTRNESVPSKKIGHY